MDVFAELLKDDVGLASLAVLAVTVAILAFFIIYFIAKSGNR
jgi:hypothetical protein